MCKELDEGNFGGVEGGKENDEDIITASRNKCSLKKQLTGTSFSKHHSLIMLRNLTSSASELTRFKDGDSRSLIHESTDRNQNVSLQIFNENYNCWEEQMST